MVHRDLKPQNLLITKSGDIKICDFGLSRYLKSDGTAATTEPHGTRYYMAPEQFAAGELTTACDIYAFGSLIYFMISGQHPWLGLTGPQIYAAQITGKRPELSGEVKSELPRGLHELMTDCMSLDPSKRPNQNDAIDRIWSIREALDFHVESDDFEGRRTPLCIVR